MVTNLSKNLIQIVEIRCFKYYDKLSYGIELESFGESINYSSDIQINYDEILTINSNKKNSN